MGLSEKVRSQPLSTQHTMDVIAMVIRNQVTLGKARGDIAHAINANNDILSYNVGRLIREQGLPFLERLESELVRNTPSNNPFRTEPTTTSHYRTEPSIWTHQPTHPEFTQSKWRPLRNHHRPSSPPRPSLSTTSTVSSRSQRNPPQTNHRDFRSRRYPTTRLERKEEWKRKSKGPQFIRTPLPDNRYTQTCIDSNTVKCWTDPTISELCRIPNNPFWKHPRVRCPTSTSMTHRRDSPHPSMPELLTPPPTKPNSPTWSSPDSSWDRQWSPEKYRRTPTPGFTETPPSPLPDLTLVSFKEELDAPNEPEDDQTHTPEKTPEITIKTPTSPRYDPDLCMKCQKSDHEFIHCPDKTKFPTRICSDRSRPLNDTTEGLEDLYEKYYLTSTEFFDEPYDDDYDDTNLDR
jgi:hypothetical protein